MSNFTIAVFYAGYALGGILGGFLSDTYGRKLTIQICSFCSYLCYFLTIFCGDEKSWFSSVLGISTTGNLVIYTILRNLAAFFGICWFITSFTYAVEIFPNKYRSSAGFLIGILWAGAFIVLAIFAYFFRDWRQLTMSGMVFSFPLIFYLIMPESPAYLFSQGKFEDLSRVFYDFGVKNGLSKNSIDQAEIHKMLLILDENNKKKNTAIQKRTMLDLFCHGPNMTKITIKLATVWFAVGVIYYGIFLNAGELPYSTYVVLATYSTSDVISKIIGGKLINHKSIGRKNLLLVTLLLAGFCCFSSGVLNGILKREIYFQDETSSRNAKIAILIFATLGRFAISSTYGIIYVYTAEHYPTQVRSNAVAFGVMSSQLAATVSKFILMLSGINFLIPEFIFLGLCLLSVYMTVTLFETNGIPMINSFEEMELFYTGKKSIQDFL